MDKKKLDGLWEFQTEETQDSVSLAALRQMQTADSDWEATTEAVPLCTLVQTSGEQQGRIVTVTSNDIIGRDASANVCIPTPDISRHHARLFANQGRWWIVDLDSRNGTLVNGERVSRHQLRNGEQIHFGNTSFSFSDGPAHQGGQPLKPHETDRLRSEMNRAGRAQTGLLPRVLSHGGLRVFARMLPADEVGGDYYDLLPMEDQGCWLAVGDVAGHGLSAGIVMMMVQSAIATAVRRDPTARPADILSLVNGVVHTNVRQRIGRTQHITLLLMHHQGDGTFCYAGAHEEILVYRQATGSVEQIETRGAWLGAVADVSKVMPEDTLELAAGDVLLLFTDGVTEAQSQDGERYGVQRLVTLLEGCAEDGAAKVLERAFASISAHCPSHRVDDQTIMVVERAESEP